MKDRYSGKSRGFGFVTFAEKGSAKLALATEHIIDGRRCEAKVALPKVINHCKRTDEDAVSQIRLQMDPDLARRKHV
jgi:RNA-binding protein Musashi